MPPCEARLIEEKLKLRKVETPWRLAVIASFTSLIATPFYRTSGIMYVLLIEEFNISREQASRVMMFLGCGVHVSGFAAGILQKYISTLNIALLGSIVVWSSIVASAFAPSLTWMSVTFGVGHGFGTGVMIMVLALIILENFVKYRGIATGIQYAGGMASGIFFPKFLLFLREQYGFRGMLLITGGLLMHATLFSFLLKVSSSPKKHTSPKISSANGGPNPLAPNHVNDSALTNGVTTTSCKNDERRSYSLSLLMFAQPMFYVIFCSAVTMHYTQHVFTSTSVDLAIDRGSNLRKAAFIPVTASASGLLGRTLLPLLADTNCLGSRSLVMFCHFFLGLFMILLAEVSSFELLLLASLCGSICFACGITMKTVLMADCVGIDAVGVCCGVAGLGILPLFIGDPWIVGFFRDSMGSYDNLYRLLGGLNIFVGLILCLSVCYQRKHIECWKT